MAETLVTTNEVVAAVERERNRLLAAIDGLGDGLEKVAVTPEGWTAQDVLATSSTTLGRWRSR